MTVVPLLTTSILAAWAVTHESLLSGWDFYIWLVVSIILTFTSATALTPPTFLAMIYGYFLGWSSLPFLFMLNLGAICLVFGLASFLNPGQTRIYLEEVYPKTRKLFRRFQEKQLRLIFFAKLSPILPFAVTNLFFAIAGARLRQVLIGGTFGMIPRTILAVWVGNEARDIRYLLEHPNEGLFSKILILVLICISSAGIGYLFKDRDVAEN